MPEIYPAKSPDDIRKGVDVIKDAWGAEDLTTVLKDFLIGIKTISKNLDVY
jgi:predicted GNAT superfamily acetyltransferase